MKWKTFYVTLNLTACRVTEWMGKWGKGPVTAPLLQCVSVNRCPCVLCPGWRACQSCRNIVALSVSLSLQIMAAWMRKWCLINIYPGSSRAKAEECRLRSGVVRCGGQELQVMRVSKPKISNWNGAKWWSGKRGAGSGKTLEKWAKKVKQKR